MKSLKENQRYVSKTLRIILNLAEKNKMEKERVETIFAEVREHISRASEDDCLEVLVKMAYLLAEFIPDKRIPHVVRSNTPLTINIQDTRPVKGGPLDTWT